MAEAEAVYLEKFSPPAVRVTGEDRPVAVIDVRGLQQLGKNLASLFEQYRSDRRIQELRWLRNLRQYLGYYDDEIERSLAPNRSRAYPKITRVKCISMLSRIMDLMFPSDDKNWTLKARPSPEMTIADIKEAVMQAFKRDQANGTQPDIDDDYVQAAISDLAQARAKALQTEIDDQLQELGGDQSYDYVALVKQVVNSGIIFGIGTLLGPFAREVPSTSWSVKNGRIKADKSTKYMPQFEFVRCWDFYPDLSAKRIEDGDGYFVRSVLSKRQLRKLADREDFFADVIKAYLSSHDSGNYKAQEFETELRTMGVKANVNEQKAYTTKYEVLTWRGPVDGRYLRLAGVEVPDDKMAEQIDAEVWILDGYVIKAKMNAWVEMGVDTMRMSHSFIFDHDDTAPIGFGLPNIVRDTQMSIAASTRMLLDNASIVCGPILEVNRALMAPDQDVGKLHAYKIFFRDDEGPTQQFPAVREVKIDANLGELQNIIKLFMQFADVETFVSPMNGGDMSSMPSEPMRNAAGASMLMGHAALPFKDIIRNFDMFTMSVILSLVNFNRKLNPDKAPVAEYDVIARGATSLIAKEVRGIQVDSLATTLTEDEKIQVDTRKLVEARLAVRDLTDMLLPVTEANRRQAAADAQRAQDAQSAQQLQEAQIRKLLSDAVKNIAQGDKNSAAASADAVNTALDILERGDQNALMHAQTLKTHAETAQQLAGIPANGNAQPDDGSSADGGPPSAGDDGSGQLGASGGPGVPDAGGGAGLGGYGLLPPGGAPGGAGQGAGLA